MKLTTLLLVFFLPILCFAQTPQEVWMDKLASCESGKRDTIVILDSNNKYSYGRYMFQLDTFYGFGRQYNILPKEMEKWEAKLLISNPTIQTSIAKKMLDDGLSYHWLNCKNKIGQYPRQSS